MDKKQIHKIGKVINKSVKFVKQNIVPIATATIPIVGTAIINRVKENNK